MTPAEQGQSLRILASLIEQSDLPAAPDIALVTAAGRASLVVDRPSLDRIAGVLGSPVIAAPVSWNRDQHSTSGDYEGLLVSAACTPPASLASTDRT